MKLASGTAPVPGAAEGRRAGRPRHGRRGQQQRPRHVRGDAAGGAPAQARVARTRGRCPPATCSRMATIEGARAARHGPPDRLARARQARRPHRRRMRSARQTPMYDPLSHLVYVTRGDDVRTTIVNGRVLMRERKVMTLDEAAVLAEARTLAEQVRKAVRQMNVLHLRAAQIERRIVELAAEIEADYPADDEIHLVGVLKGGFVFMADLVRAMSARVTLDFIAVSSYQQSTRSSGEVRLLKDVDARLEGRHVDHRRRHRRHRPDADVSAGHPARAGAEIAAHGLSPQQAVAPAGRRQGRVRRLHDRGQVRHRLRARFRREVPEPAAHRGDGRSVTVVTLPGARSRSSDSGIGLRRPVAADS